MRVVKPGAPPPGWTKVQHAGPSGAYWRFTPPPSVPGGAAQSARAAWERHNRHTGGASLYPDGLPPGWTVLKTARKLGGHVPVYVPPAGMRCKKVRSRHDAWLAHSELVGSSGLEGDAPAALAEYARANDASERDLRGAELDADADEPCEMLAAPTENTQSGVVADRRKPRLPARKEQDLCARLAALTPKRRGAAFRDQTAEVERLAEALKQLTEEKDQAGVYYGYQQRPLSERIASQKPKAAGCPLQRRPSVSGKRGSGVQA